MDKLQIALEQNQKIFFTSDTHYGHKNVLNFCHRPWENIKDMNDGLVDSWNRVVGHNDIVFILGDFVWFSDSRAIAKILNKLNGKHIYIILGNHDKLSGFKRIDTSRVTILSDIVHLYISHPKLNFVQEVICSHYPLMTWSHREKGSINLHGHIHSGKLSERNTDIDLPSWIGQQYDIGVDNNDYKPIELTEVLHKLNFEKNQPPTDYDLDEILGDVFII